jgi:hypothetical protein
VTANLSAGGLRIVGSEAVDAIRVTESNGAFTVQGLRGSFASNSVCSIAIDARGGDLIDLAIKPRTTARGKAAFVRVDGGAGIDQVRASRGVGLARVVRDAPAPAAPDPHSGAPTPDPVPNPGGDPAPVAVGPSPVITWVDGVGTLDYSAWTTTVVVELRAGTAPGVASTAGITRVIGTPLGDTLLGWYGNDVLIGGDGDDAIDGRGGNDTIERVRSTIS